MSSTPEITMTPQRWLDYAHACLESAMRQWPNELAQDADEFNRAADAINEATAFFRAGQVAQAAWRYRVAAKHLLALTMIYERREDWELAGELSIAAHCFERAVEAMDL